MSKPISISFGKSKIKSTAPSSTPTFAAPRSKYSAFTADADDQEEEKGPTHETVLGFASDGGAILSTPVREKEQRVIENKGNADWRTRGRPSTSQQQQEQQQRGESGGVVVRTVETDEASRKVGLQLAENSINNTTTDPTANGELSQQQNGHRLSPQQPESDPVTAAQSTDQAALSALLNGDNAKSSSSTTIIHQSQSQPETYTSTVATTKGDETLDFRADVASRPDTATLADYAAMPVEEFGMALLRGMGKKRRANGEVIVIKNPNAPEEEKKKKTGKERDPNAGFLGIGAKAVKIEITGTGRGSGGAAEDGLGAWGKADMRRSGKAGKAGDGLYTPVMLRHRRTGELITERELEDRRKAVLENESQKARRGREARDEEDWRERRDRNLKINGSRRRGDDRDDRPTDPDPLPPNHKPNGTRRKLIENISTSSSSSRREHGSSRNRPSPSRESRPRDENHPDPDRHGDARHRPRARNGADESPDRDRDRDHDPARRRRETDRHDPESEDGGRRSYDESSESARRGERDRRERQREGERNRNGNRREGRG